MQRGSPSDRRHLGCSPRPKADLGVIWNLTEFYGATDPSSLLNHETANRYLPLFAAIHSLALAPGQHTTVVTKFSH